MSSRFDERRGSCRRRPGADGRPATERAATIECVNAQARRRGLTAMPVRGLAKVKAVALWHALAHKLPRLMAQPALAAA